MRTVRCNVFETNSSSEHSITILDEKDYLEFKAQKCYYDPYNGDFINVQSWIDDIHGVNDDIKKATDEEITKAFEWFINYLKDHINDEIKGWDISDWDDEWDGLPEREQDIVKYMCKNSGPFYLPGNWAYNYPEGDIDEHETPHGDKVYVLSYSGYGD